MEKPGVKNTTYYVSIFLILIVLFAAVLLKNKSSGKIVSTTTPTSTSTPGMIGPSKTLYLTMDMDISEWMYRQHVSGRVSDWYDPELFTYLMQNHIPVTFFVSGLFAQAYPDLIKELNSTGNYSFQNHSYDESSFIPDCYQLPILTTDQAKINQINTTQSILKNLTGQIPTQFRFPGDCHSLADDQLVKNLGLTINSGTIIAGDPFNQNTTAIVAAIMEGARNNAVILMHIGGPNAPKSLEVLKQIVPALEKEGYVFEKTK